jgi:hypothetical protein
MKDKEPIIQACYMDIIKLIFTTFYTGMMDKKVSPAGIQNLEKRFTAGITRARQVRESSNTVAAVAAIRMVRSSAKNG